VHYVQYQYFLFYIFLISGRGWVGTQRTPLPTGLGLGLRLCAYIACVYC